MRLKPGCGCLALVLAGLNAFVTISTLVGMVQGTSSVGIALFMLVVFVSNVALCIVVGLQTIRSRNTGMASSADGEETTDMLEQEGEDQL